MHDPRGLRKLGGATSPGCRKEVSQRMTSRGGCNCLFQTKTPRTEAPEVLKLKAFSAVKQRVRERKGPPEIIQKFRLRNWPVASAEIPMTPMEGTKRHLGPF